MWTLSKEGDCVWKCNDDGTYTVCTIDNVAYLAWVAEGNTAEEWTGN